MIYLIDSEKKKRKYNNNNNNNKMSTMKIDSNYLTLT